jgi:HD-like signal output (HDOD) protein/CheY-like chemotaxis protein
LVQASYANCEFTRRTVDDLGMRKLLFVEEDASRRKVLESSLVSYSDRWEICFAASAKSAHSELEATSWDVVIADLVSQDGRSILADVRVSSPEAVRIGLVDRMQSSVPHISYIHQFITRPIDPRELEVAVERSCKLKELLEGELISRTVGALGELPSAPSVYLKLVDKLNEPDASVDEVAEIVAGDIAISARLLQLANSAIFRTSREIATVKMAASYLGLSMVRNLVLASEVFRAFADAHPVMGFSVEGLQSHARLTAGIVAGMDLPKGVQNSAAVAALLHDAGKLVLACKMPDRFSRLLSRASEKNQPLFRVEEELWGITHAEIGAYLLGLWGLPVGITEAVAYHHSPSRVPHYRFDAVAAVHIANLLAHECEGSTADLSDCWDLALVKDLGIAHLIPGWKEVGMRLVEQERQVAQGVLQ